MDAHLLRLAEANDGVLSSGDAARLGVSSSTLDRLVRLKELVRVRRSAYVLTSAWSDAKPDERLVLTTKAVLRDRTGDAASHHCALLMQGIRTYEVDRQRIDLVSKVNKIRSRSGIRVHPLPELLAFQGPWRMVTLPFALAQVAGEATVESAVVSRSRNP